MGNTGHENTFCGHSFAKRDLTRVRASQCKNLFNRGDFRVSKATNEWVGRYLRSGFANKKIEVAGSTDNNPRQLMLKYSMGIVALRMVPMELKVHTTNGKAKKSWREALNIEECS